MSITRLKCPQPFNFFFLVDVRIFQELVFDKNFQKYWILIFLRVLKVKVVWTIFSPIVRISPPLGQCTERDVRKGQRASLSCWNVWRFTENAEKMVEKCVVYGCSNSKNKQKGISIYKIPSYSDPRAEVQRRKKRWIKFINQTRKHWTLGKTSPICSVHFKHEDCKVPVNSKTAHPSPGNPRAFDWR